MNVEEAFKAINRQAPCPHYASDTSLGDGRTWAKCYDCGALFPQDGTNRARESAKQFDDAVACLQAAIEALVAERDALKAAPTVEKAPVAWVHKESAKTFSVSPPPLPDEWTPLYTSPPVASPTMPTEPVAIVRSVLDEGDKGVRIKWLGTFLLGRPCWAVPQIGQRLYQAPPQHRSPPQRKPLTEEELHTFLNAAAGEGLVLDGVDAADLYASVFPERYAKAARGITGESE